MLEQLRSLVEGIEKAEKELQSIEKKINAKDKIRLEKILQIAKRGVKWQKIIESERAYTRKGFEDYPSEIEYHKNEKDQFIKGIKVDFIDKGTSNGGTGKYVKELQLWLMQDGTFTAFDYTADVDYFQGSWSTYNRHLYEDNVDVFEQDEEEGKFIWDIDYIVKSITGALEHRLRNLGQRTKAQTERLEKIEKLTIK